VPTKDDDSEAAPVECIRRSAERRLALFVLGRGWLMTDARRWRLVFPVFLVLTILPGRVSASLGGDASSVTADRVHVQGALLRLTRADAYNVQEMQSATGVVIREYSTSTGDVFAVAWQGPWPPDLRQLLGAYYQRFQEQAERSASTRKRRGALSLQDGDLIVETSGHQRSFSGRALLPRLVPRGLDLQAIR
jgi:hypothetical protein